MELTNEVLEKIEDKKSFNRQYSKWYYSMGQLQQDKQSVLANSYFKKSERINDCMNLFQWDLYRENKLMDLQRVNRCMNNRFCPNCRKLDLAKMIHKFKKPFSDLIKQGYLPFLLTLTIPNVTGEELEQTIRTLSANFRKFYHLYSRELPKGFKGRSLGIDAALKVLEITYNKESNTFHPHYHLMVFIPAKFYDQSLFSKIYQGHWSYKRQEFNMYSDIDLEMARLWTMVNKKIRINQKNFDNMSDDIRELYQVDIKEMDSSGIYEVLKYTFKDSDISSFYVFKTLVESLYKKRIRQGHGLLYNFKCEEVEEGEKQDLEEFLDKKENPEHILTHEINELLTVYRDFRKVSRFKALAEIENLE